FEGELDGEDVLAAVAAADDLIDDRLLQIARGGEVGRNGHAHHVAPAIGGAVRGAEARLARRLAVVGAVLAITHHPKHPAGVCTIRYSSQAPRPGWGGS